MSRKSIFGMAGAAAFVISVVLVQAQTSNVTNLISAPEARKMIAEGKFDLVLDVRTPEEYNGPLGHIKGAKLIPVQNLEAQLKTIEAYKGKKVLVYCHSGKRSDQSAKFLKAKGFTSVFDMTGGMRGWKIMGFESEIEVSKN
ncbi:MAG: rhodanese-like domain-containing protein [Nitrospinota bacterium]|nr:rhodanese-like domain-containing protein [Nitrospinota bacterium]